MDKMAAMLSAELQNLFRSPLQLMLLTKIWDVKGRDPTVLIPILW